MTNQSGIYPAPGLGKRTPPDYHSVSGSNNECHVSYPDLSTLNSRQCTSSTLEPEGHPHSTPGLTSEKPTCTAYEARGYTSADGPDRAPNLALIGSLGSSGIMTIAGGAILITVSVGFLSFIWFGAGSPSEGQDAPSVWRRITLSGWTPQAITLIALVLRTIVTAQAAVCTSMMAGLILERSFVLKSQVAHFSILRVISNGPASIVRRILASCNLKMIVRIESLLGIILLFVTTGLQFSSTILLSDLYESNINGDKVTVQLQSFLSETQQRITTTQHLYSVLEPTFAIYGESALNTTKLPDSYGLSDSGIVERAFLPIGESEKRMKVRSYEGGATIFNSRTACMRPEILNWELGASSWDNREDSGFGQLNATLDYGLSIEKTGANGTCSSESCPDIPFSCYLAGAYDGYGWQSTYCFVGGVGGTLWPPTEGPGTATIDKPWSVNSSIYIVFSTNMRNEDWATADSLGILSNDSLAAPTMSDYEEWRSYQIMPGRFVNASLCFQAYNLVFSYVHMTAMGAVMEPNITYNSSTGGIDTRTVQSYFGSDSTRQDPSQRGLLQIENTQNQPISGFDENRDLTIQKLSMKIYGELVSDPYTNNSILACYHCSCGDVTPNHPDLTSLLGDTLNSTSRAADLIQTYVFSLALIIYYQSLETFTVPVNVTLSSIQTTMTAQACRSRGGCSGFVSIVTLLVIHATIVIVITTLYITKTRFSRYSNVWHAVSQLASGELDDIMASSSSSSDRKAVRTIKREGNYHVKIGIRPGSGRIGVIKVSESE
ncbi:hypothetical protein F5Y19DRAFT_492333 [Xylariaceae sp. FL1651]|nr:hypothetical protein F5Y19DRAFT_492333 [Xylariaceae sp. FL1651]